MGWSGSRLTNLVGGVVSMRERVGWAAAAAFLVVLALLGSLWSNPSFLLANALNGEEILLQDGTPIAIVIASYGNVSVIHDRGTPDERMMSPVKPGLLLFRGDQISTGEDSWIEVEFEQTARVRVAPSSRVEVVTGLLREVDPETGEQLPTLRLWVGRVWVHVAEALSRLRNFSVETPSAIAGVRGTLFAVDVGVTGRTIVSVREGVVAVASPLAPRNEYLVGVGEEIEVLPEQEPMGPRLLGAEESRRWGEMQPWLKEQEEWKASRREQAQGGLFGFFSRLLRPGKEQGAEEGLEEPASQAAGGTPASSGGGRSWWRAPVKLDPAVTVETPANRTVFAFIFPPRVASRTHPDTPQLAELQWGGFAGRRDRRFDRPAGSGRASPPGRREGRRGRRRRR